MIQSSSDEGKSWTDSHLLLSFKGKVDYPQLLQFKDVAYVVVNTSEGLKVKVMQP